MSWTPEPIVLIGGEDETTSVVESLSVRRGRDTVYAEVQAGFASVRLLRDAPPTVGERLEAFVNNSAGTAVPLFAGVISDWRSDTVATDGDPLVFYNIQAVGPIARLNRLTVLFTGRPVETDGERVGAAITAGLSLPWEEVGGTFDELAARSFDKFEPGLDPSLFDAGVFDVAALPAADSGYSALQIAQQAASSSEGVLFETANGFVGYADANRRASAGTADFVNVPFAEVSTQAFQVSENLSDITNRVTVEFEGGAIVDQDSASILAFGAQATRLSTNLVDQGNAESRAALFLERHSQLSRSIGRVEVNLRGVDDGLRDQMLIANTNTPLTITGLPAPIGIGSTFDGFVEGVDFRVSKFECVVGLLVSDAALSTGLVVA